MNFIYWPNDSEVPKTRAHSYFYEINCSRGFFSFSTERFNPLQPGVAFLYPLKTSEKFEEVSFA